MNDPYPDLVVQLAERERTRVYGKYRGLVREISDPQGMGRIKAEVPAVYADQVSPWAMPCVPFAGPQHGLALLPEVGDGVWIEFEGGDISLPIWSGCWWASNQRPSPTGKKARLLATSAGHQVLVDEDANEISLVHPGGAEVTLGQSEVVISIGNCELKLTATEVSINRGMVKVTQAGVSLLNDAMQIGV